MATWDSGTYSYIQSATDDAFDNFNHGDKIIVSGASNSTNNGVQTILNKEVSAGNWVRLIITGDLTDESAGATVTIKKYDPFGDELIALADAAVNGNVDIFSADLNNWDTAQITPVDDMGDSGFGGMAANYHYVDHALRVSDANFNNSSRVKWFGFIDRKHPETEYYAWYELKGTLPKPAGITYVQEGDSYLGSAGGCNFEFTMADEGTSTWDAETSDDGGTIYSFGMSYIYDGNQESLIQEARPSTENFTVNAGQKVSIQARITTPFSAVQNGERISGMRLYCRKKDTSDRWVLLMDMSLQHGVRASLDSEYNDDGWTENAANNYYSPTIDVITPNLETFDSINGYSPDEFGNDIGGINEGYKTSVVCNRRTFIANVKVLTNDSADPKHFGDRIMYSQPGMFDVFPTRNYIDVVLGDSEEYVKLEEFADRLLAFKHKTLFVINVSNGLDTGWFLENSYKHKGVKHPGASVRTEYGVAWVNNSGCYFYDGNKIIDLTENKISPTGTAPSGYSPSWETFVTDNTIIGYAPKDKQLIVMADCTDSAANYAYIYDFRSRSWVYNTTLFSASTAYTNFAINGDNNLIIAQGAGVMEEYSPDSADNGSIEVITKAMDLGEPYKLKRLYRIAVTYKSTDANATPLEISYIDKDGAFVAFADVASVNFANTSAVWKVAVFKPSPSLVCQSFQLRLNPPATEQVSINDISCEYRVLHKGVR